jgi:hypothetical protein
MTNSKKSLTKFIVIILINLLLFSCEKKTIERVKIEENKDETIETFNENEIILGKKRGLSGSVSNIKNAMKKLGYTLESKDIQPNAIYVKILPSSPEDISFIDTTSTIAIYDYPLDYEILQEGDFYIDPSIEDTIYNTRYAIIEDEDEIPENIDYVIEEYIRMPETEEEAAAYLYSQLLLGEVELPIGTDTADYIEDNKAGWYPKLKIVLSEPDGNINMSNIKIRIGARLYTTNTDGYINCNKHYGQIKVESRFQNSIATIRKGYNEIIGVDRYDAVKAVNPSSGTITVAITKTGMLNPDVWHKATIYASILKYNAFCSLNGIQTASDLNIWTSSWFSGAACPLFRKLGGVDFTFFHAIAITFASGLDLGSATINTLITMNLGPDILIDELPYTQYYNLYLFHELSHFSHAVKRGKTYWHPVVAGEMENIRSLFGDPYGNGNQPTPSVAQRIALAESWASFMAVVIGNEYNYSGSLEYYTPHTIPSIQKSTYGWMPNGIYWDILDNSSDNISLLYQNTPNVVLTGSDSFNGIVNNISVFKLYNIITNNNFNTILDYKSILKSQYTNSSIQIENLFNLYGY